MKYTFGFIGTGNMGSAIAKAVAKCKSGKNIALANRSTQKAQLLADEIDAVVLDNKTVAQQCNYIFLGVKPQMMEQVLLEIKDILQSRKSEIVLISMAAGLTTDKICEMAGGAVAVVRIMPNTPVAIGKGVIVYCSNYLAKEKEAFVADALSMGGLVDKIDENLIDIATVVMGCAPAFAALFAENLAKGGEHNGLKKEKAILYAAKMMEGTAALMLETGKPPEALRKEVCSPGGSTIKGVESLMDNDFENIVKQAVNASYNRTQELGK